MKKNTKKLIYHIIEILFSMALTAWFLLTIYIENTFIIKPAELISSFVFIFGPEYSFLHPLSFIIFLIPLITLIKLAAPFFSNKIAFLFSPDSYIALILNLINSIIALFIISIFMIIDASSAAYFTTINPITYTIAGLSLAMNIFQVIRLIQKFKTLSAGYRKFLTYLESSGKDKKAKQAKSRGILQKLLFSVISTILIIIVLLSYMVLSENKKAILSSVINNGVILVEQTGTFAEESATRINTTMPTYLLRIKEKELSLEDLFISLM